MRKCFFWFFLGVLIVLLPTRTGKSQEPSAGTPNLIFILSDDQGWADIGYHGSPIATPHLDRLARNGIRLGQHYVHPVCSPTRAALLTGRMPSRFGILGAIGGDSRQYLPPEVPTLPAILSSKGYRTHISGKWHLALSQEFGPTRYGFDTSYGYIHGQIDPYTHRYKFGDRTWHRNDELIDEEGHVTDLISRDAVRFIESAGEEPFFLYVAYSVPHYPLAEPDEWAQRYEGRFPERSRRLYAASLSHMDSGIGQIVDALEKAGLDQKTLLVFSSDNGGQQSWLQTADLYEGRYPPDPVLGSNEPLRGWKGQVYEGGIRVPAFAHWPGVLEPREVTDPIHIVDWVPTFLHLAEAEEELPEELDGRNIWPVLRGSAAPAAPRPIYIKASSGSALRFGDWKLVELRSGETQLFNIRRDPAEEFDVAPENPEPLRNLSEMLEEQRRMDGEPSYWSGPPGVTPQKRSSGSR